MMKSFLILLMSVLLLCLSSCGIIDLDFPESEATDAITDSFELYIRRCCYDYRGKNIRPVYDKLIQEGVNVSCYYNDILVLSHDIDKYVMNKISINDYEKAVQFELLTEEEYIIAKRREDGYADSISTSKPGDLVEFGNYYISSSETKEPITWIVLEATESSRLIISKDIIYYAAFNDTLIAEATSWKNSTVRSWLNKEFINELFSSSEKKKIIKTSITEDGYSTKDYLFLLSYDEFIAYKPYLKRTAYSTLFAFNNTPGYHSGVWWTRTTDDTVGSYKKAINEEGENKNSPRVNEDEGIRPALWISIK